MRLSRFLISCDAAPGPIRNGVAVNKEAGEPQNEIYDFLSDLLGPVSGPLDRPLSVTQFADATSKRQTRANLSLRQFAETIRDTRAPTKSELPWLKLARFGDVATTKGALRHDANLTAIDGIEGDYDAGEVTVAEACERLSAANLAALVYTTPSHAPSAPRWRVLVPTAATLQPGEREALCERLNGALGGILAPESFTRSQAYYFGAVGAGDHHEVRLVDGRSIDRADDIGGVGRASVAAPADEPFQIVFANNDAGIPHNVEIKDAAGMSVFKGDLFNGVETRTYDVPALTAGAYTFICTVHPNMAGTLTVG